MIVFWSLVLAGLLLSETKKPFSPREPVKFASRSLGLVFSAAGLLFLLSESLFFRAQTDYFALQFYRSLSVLNAAIRLNPSNQLYRVYQTADKISLNGGAADNWGGVQTKGTWLNF